MTNHNQTNEDRSPLILRFLGIKGEMTEKERSDFLKELESDEDLKAELLLTKGMLDLANRDDYKEEEFEVESLAMETEYEKQLYAVLSDWDWAKDIPSAETENKSDEDVVSKDPDQNDVENVDTSETNEIPFVPLAPSEGQVITSSNETVHPASVEPDSASAVASAVPSSMPRIGSRFTYWLSGIVAVLVIGFFIGKSLWAGPEYKFEDWKPEGEGVARGSEQDTIPDLLKRADYAKALDVIRTEMIKLENDKPKLESNIENLSEESKYELNDYQSKLERYLWYKGNALIGLDSTKEVIPVLCQLDTMDSPYYKPLDSLYHVYK